MGIDTIGCQFLCGLRNGGVSFANTATLGRQSFFPAAKQVECVALHLALRQGQELIERCNGDGNRFFKLLGARRVTTIDATNYEGADQIFDLNYPIDFSENAHLAAKFSVVFDGGTIEHVFNAGQALKNSMEMVAVGGYFVAVQMANNYLGHGFYQFSPEFYFASLSEENGFRICAAILSTTGPVAYYSVSSPRTCSHRISLCNDRPTYILVVAQRVADCDLFRTAPQQHFYKKAWEAGATAKQNHVDSFTSKVLRRVPSRIKEAGKMLWGYNTFAFSGRGFRPLTEEEVVTGVFLYES